MKKNGEKRNKINLKENKKNIAIISVIILLILIIILILKLVVFTSNSFASIKYQAYTKNKGTSSFKNNGEIIETKNPIVGLKILISGKYNGAVYYNISNEFESKECYSGEECFLNNEINNISIGLIDTLNNKYDIYYRIFFNNKWSNWFNDGRTISSNKKGINKIQIKLVPKDAYLGDYLDDYEVINNE